MKKRITIPQLTQKRIYQEASSACAFCREPEVASLQIHHIDEDPSNNEEKNLILVCGTCHGKITAGVISQSDVVLQKRIAEFKCLESIKKRASIEVNVSGGNYQGDVAQIINKYKTSKNLKITHPPGSIGANLELKGYIDYLITRYFDFKKADSSYGQKKPFSHSVIHKNIQKYFGGKTFFLPEEKFGDLTVYLQNAINRTILGKNNNSKGKRNYHSFDEHLK